MAVPWLRRLVTGLSQRRLGFAPRPVRVVFVVDKMAQGRVFLRVFRVLPYQYHSTRFLHTSSGTCCSYQEVPVALTRRYLLLLPEGTCCSYQKVPVALTRRYLLLLPEGQTDEDLEPSKKQCSFRNRGEFRRNYFQFLFLKRHFTYGRDWTLVTLNTRSFLVQNSFVLYRLHRKSTLYSRIPDFKSLSGCNPPSVICS
jgi:hypothetical protein